MNPLFSIIIPVYNVEQYLHQCLDSILAQDFNNYEVICVNDGSTDGSWQILEEYAGKYSQIKITNRQNAGTASARNDGMQQAQGDYIWFVDSDDWILEDSLFKLSEQLKLHQPDVLCFNGKLKYEDDGREEFDEGIIEHNIGGWEYYNKYALQSRKFHFVCVVLRLYKRSFLLENNLFFDNTVTHEDNLWIPLMYYYAESVDSIDMMAYVYRIREQSKMQTQSKDKIFDIVSVANKLAAFFILKTIDKTVVYREISGEYFKGFMPNEIKIYGNNDKELGKRINWDYFKQVSTYPRHKRIYKSLKISPILFRFYLTIEKLIK